MRCVSDPFAPAKICAFAFVAGPNPVFWSVWQEGDAIAPAGEGVLPIHGYRFEWLKCLNGQAVPAPRAGPPHWRADDLQRHDASHAARSATASGRRGWRDP